MLFSPPDSIFTTSGESIFYPMAHAMFDTNMGSVVSFYFTFIVLVLLR